MSDLEVIDAHVHLWEPRARPWYPVLHQYAEQGGAEVLIERHLLDDYLDGMCRDIVAGMVHVSATTGARAYLEEARWLETELAESPVPAVTIGTVDPTMDTRSILEDLDEQAESARFRGMRVYGNLDPDAASTADILSWLQERGLVFDLVAGVETMSRWVRLLDAYDDLAVVLEHLGTPTSADPAARAEWERVMRETAASTNWSCKVSGLGMILPSFTPETVRPWVEPVAEAWGWDRLLFGSNMPMDRLATTHAEVLSTLRAIVDDLADTSGARAFFRGNAQRAYGVPESE